MEANQILLGIYAARQALALIERCLATGEPVTREDIEAAFGRADAAEANWSRACGTNAEAAGEDGSPPAV